MRRATPQEIATARAWVGEVTADWALTPDRAAAAEQEYERALEVIIFANGGRGNEDPMPTFVLKAKDRLADRAIEAYLTACQDEGIDWQAEEVGEALAEFEAWQRRNPERMKLPDHEHVPVAG